MQHRRNFDGEYRIHDRSLFPIPKMIWQSVMPSWDFPTHSQIRPNIFLLKPAADFHGFIHDLAHVGFPMFVSRSWKLGHEWLRVQAGMAGGISEAPCKRLA